MRKLDKKNIKIEKAGEESLKLAEAVEYLGMLRDCEEMLWRVFGRKNVKTELKNSQIGENSLLLVKFLITRGDEEMVSPLFCIAPGLKREKFKNLISNFSMAAVMFGG